MSKRYGRNQKRAARAREAALVAREADLLAHLAATNELLKYNRQRTDRLERAANDIIAAHHEYSALIPVKRGFREIRRIVNMGPPRMDYRPSQSIPTMDLDYQVIVLNELRAAIDFDSMRGDFAVHMLVNDRPEWAYRFNGTMFGRGIPITARRDIAEAMVNQLLCYVDENWGHMIRRGMDQPRG